MTYERPLRRAELSQRSWKEIEEAFAGEAELLEIMRKIRSFDRLEVAKRKKILTRERKLRINNILRHAESERLRKLRLCAENPTAPFDEQILGLYEIVFGPAKAPAS